MTALPPPRVGALYAAGFVTAFGAHGIAANLAQVTLGGDGSLLYLGLLLALYDGAEVVLKPVFGSLADRVGARPVLLGGLATFAAASGAFAVAGGTRWIWLARLLQGAAASAFSPSAGALVARLTPTGRHGRAFGSYGFFKSIGYALGPVLGGVVVAIGGLRSLFAVMAVLAAAVALWALGTVPAVPPLARARQTLADLARRLADRRFLHPTGALAAATAALSVGVGFLPVSGAAAGLGPVVTGAAVSVLAVTAALVQPQAGRALDTGRLRPWAGTAAGLAIAAAGLGVATLPGPAAVLVAAVGIGCGTGLITPLAFAVLAAGTPPERMGQTMGSAELGRELGDAGGPLLVGAIAAVGTLSLGYGVLALLLVVAPAASALRAGRLARL